MAAEITYIPNDPMHDTWVNKESNIRHKEIGWQRMSQIVLHDMALGTGLYDEMTKSDQKIFDRQLAFAEDPNTPLTYREKHPPIMVGPYLALKSLPFIPALMALGKVDEYVSNSDKPNPVIKKVMDKINRRTELGNKLLSQSHHVAMSSLKPELDLAKFIIGDNIDAGTYVVNTDHLLQAAEASYEAISLDQQLEKDYCLNLFINAPKYPASYKDQRKRALEVFMQSNLLYSGELGAIALERELVLQPDGKDTIRAVKTTPYLDLYAYQPLTAEDYTIRQPRYKGSNEAKQPMLDLIAGSIR